MAVDSKTLRPVARMIAVASIALLAACSVTIDSESGGATQSVPLIDRVPAGAKAVGRVDIAALAEQWTEEEWGEYEDMLTDNDRTQDLERFAEATGIDLREDLDQIVFATLATSAEPDDVIVLLAADFDRDKLVSLAADAENVTYEGTTFYDAQQVFDSLERSVGTEPGEPSTDTEAETGEPSMQMDIDSDRPGYLAILDARTLAMGSRESLEAAVDVGAGRRDAVSGDTAMSELIDGVEGQGQIWLVATSETWQGRLDNLGTGGAMVPTNAIEAIEVITVSMDMSDGMQLRFSGVTATEEAATELTTSLNGLLAMGRMMLQQGEPEMFAILDRAITVAQEERSVSIEARLTDEDIDTLQRLAEEQMPR